MSAASDGWVAADRDDGELARGARLELARGLENVHPDWLSAQEREWIAASAEAEAAEVAAAAAAAAHERRQNRRLRVLLGAAVLLLVLAVAAAVGALALRNRAVGSEASARAAEKAADMARVDAESEAQTARAAEAVAEASEAVAEASEMAAVSAREDAEIERLVALSAAQVGVAPDRAILLALEANRRRDDVATRGAVQRAIATEPRLSRLVPAPVDGDSSIWLSDDGAVGVAWTYPEGVVSWFDPRTGMPVGNDVEAGQPINHAVVSGDGSTIALNLADGVTAVYRSDGVGVERVVELPRFALTLDRAGETIGLITDDENMEIVDVLNGSTLLVHTPPPPPATGGFFLLSADGDVFAYLGDTSVEVIDVATGTRRAQLPIAGPVTTASFLPDGRLATGGADGVVTVHEIPTDEIIDALPPLRLHGGGREVTLIQPTPDGGLASANGDNWVRFWRADGTRSTDGVRLTSSVHAIGVDSEGVTIATIDSLWRFARDERPIVDRRHTPDAEADPYLFADARWIEEFDGSTTDRFVSVDDGVEPIELDLSDVHADTVIYTDVTIDGESLLSYDDAATVAVTNFDGSGQQVIDLAPIYAELDAEPVLDRPPPAALPGGRELLLQVPSGEGSRVVLLDMLRDHIVAGPVEIPSSGWLRPLADGRALVSDLGEPLQLLPENLAGDPMPIPAGDGYRALHQDPASGLVLLIRPDSAALLDPATLEIRRLDDDIEELGTGAFSPDGETVAIGSASRGTQLFDVATGAPIGVPMVPSGTAFGSGPGTSWSSDGQGVWINPGGGPVRFAASIERWREIACGIVARELTEEEWHSFVSDTMPRVPACA